MQNTLVISERRAAAVQIEGQHRLVKEMRHGRGRGRAFSAGKVLSPDWPDREWNRGLLADTARVRSSHMVEKR